MNMYRKSILAALAVLVLVAGAIQVTAIAEDLAPEVQGADAPASQPSAGSDLTAVIVETDATGNPVVTLEISELRDYDSFFLEDPPRLVVDLYGVASRLEENQYVIGEAGVTRARAGQYRRTPELISRVVFDLEGPVPYEVSAQDSSLVIGFGAATPVALAEPLPIDQPQTVAVAQVDPVLTVHEVEAVVPQQVAERDVDDVTTSLDSVSLSSDDVIDTMIDLPIPSDGAADLDSRSVEEDALERLLQTPTLASKRDSPSQGRAIPTQSFETKKIVTETTKYTGKLVSLNLVDADIKQVFRLFHEISGLNFVLHPQVDGRVTIVLDNVPWDLALDLILKNNGLDKVLEGNVIRIAPTRQLAAEAAERKQLKLAEELEVEPVTITRTLSYARARDIERVIRDGGVLSERGKVIVDERTNTLIISDIPKKVSPLDILISSLDSETPQVMIEARIVETSR